MIKVHKIKKGFTLAEVLITIGIIGTISALTIPVLISNHRKNVVATKLKKFYSVMSQAVTMSEIENGPSSEWIMNFQSYKDAITFYNTYLDKFLSKITVNKRTGAQGVTIILNDGSAFTLFNGACADFKYFLNFKNATKNLEELIPGKDYFSFRICSQSNEAYYAGGKAGGFRTASNGNLAQRLDRDFLIEHCKSPFNDGDTCTALIEFDGWEIKKDYPHRF